MAHQKQAPTAYPAVGACFWFARSEDSNRATAPQRRNQQSGGLLVSPRESPRGMRRSAGPDGGQPYGKRRAAFYCYSPGRRVGASSGTRTAAETAARRRILPLGAQAFRQNCPHRKRSPARRGCVSFFCPAGGREGRTEGGKASFVGRIAQEHAWKTGNSNIKAGICDKKTKRKVGTENLPGPGIYGRIKATKRTPSGPHNEKKRRR